MDGMDGMDGIGGWYLLRVNGRGLIPYSRLILPVSPPLAALHPGVGWLQSAREHGPSRSRFAASNIHWPRTSGRAADHGPRGFAG